MLAEESKFFTPINSDIVPLKAKEDNYIKGGIVEDSVINSHPDWYPIMADLGTTDIWYLDHQMQTDLSTSLTNLAIQVPAVINAGMNFHFCVMPFTQQGGGGYADPSDPDYLQFFLMCIEEILTGFPEIKGISLNDYLYPDTYWDTSTQEARLQNRQNLINFAEKVKELVHNYGKIFTINMYPITSHDAYIEDLAPVADYIMPEIYRGWNTAPIGVSLNEQHRWFKDTLEANISMANMDNVLPSVISKDFYIENGYPDEPVYTTEDIMKDINIVMDHDCPGVVLYAWGSAPNDMFLPDGKCVHGNYSTRMTTWGEKEGEGFSVSKNMIITSLTIKIPIGHSLRVYTDPYTYTLHHGTGNYELIFDTETSVYKIVSEGIDSFTSYIDLTSISLFGKDIVERFPEHSPIHESDNLGNILITESIGREFDNILNDAIINCNGRYLEHASSEWLDKIGSWFGVYRGDMDDEDYRNVIFGMRASNLTFSGIKNTLSILLKIPESDITIINGTIGCCFTGKSLIADHYVGTPQAYAGFYKQGPGIITIIIPNGTDTSIITANLMNIVIPGVQVWIKEA